MKPLSQLEHESEQTRERERLGLSSRRTPNHYQRLLANCRAERADTINHFLTEAKHCLDVLDRAKLARVRRRGVDAAPARALYRPRLEVPAGVVHVDYRADGRAIVDWKGAREDYRRDADGRVPFDQKLKSTHEARRG